MGGDGHHVAARADAQLRAGRYLLRRIDEFFHDAAHARELVEVGLGGLRGHRELHPRKGLAKGLIRLVLGIAEERVALAGEAVVELDDRLLEPRPLGAELLERFLHLLLVVQVLEAEG